MRLNQFALVAATLLSMVACAPGFAESTPAEKISVPLKYQVTGPSAKLSAPIEAGLRKLPMQVAVPYFVPSGCMASSFKPKSKYDSYNLRYTCGKRYFTVIGTKADGLGDIDMDGILSSTNPAFKNEFVVGTHHPFDTKGNPVKKTTFVSSSWVTDPSESYAYRIDAEGFTREEILNVMSTLRYLRK